MVTSWFVTFYVASFSKCLHVGSLLSSRTLELSWAAFHPRVHLSPPSSSQCGTTKCHHFFVDTRQLLKKSMTGLLNTGECVSRHCWPRCNHIAKCNLVCSFLLLPVAVIFLKRLGLLTGGNSLYLKAEAKKTELFFVPSFICSPFLSVTRFSFVLLLVPMGINRMCSYILLRSFLTATNFGPFSFILFLCASSIPFY